MKTTDISKTKPNETKASFYGIQPDNGSGLFYSSWDLHRAYTQVLSILK